MDHEHLASLLSRDETDSPAAARCPDVLWIAGYVDGGLDPGTRHRVELHLADCADCLELVGLLCRERDAAVREEPTASVQTAAARRWNVRALLDRSPSASAWAAAAAIGIVVPVLYLLGPHLPGFPPGPPPGDARTTTRLIDASGSRLRVLAPLPGGVLERRGLAFRWSEVAGSPYYDVRIVTDAGDLVAHERVDGTTWRPPATLALQPGTAYFFHVDAYPAGDKAVGSTHVPFEVAD